MRPAGNIVMIVERDYEYLAVEEKREIDYFMA